MSQDTAASDGHAPASEPDDGAEHRTQEPHEGLSCEDSVAEHADAGDASAVMAWGPQAVHIRHRPWPKLFASTLHLRVRRPLSNSHLPRCQLKRDMLSSARHHGPLVFLPKVFNCLQ